MSRRQKKYRPKRVHLPVMGALRDEFSLTLRMASATASLGCFNKNQYDRIGGCLNCIVGAIALMPEPLKDASISKVLDGAVRAMNQCGDRGSASGEWTLSAHEQMAVLAGIMKAEEALRYLGVFELKEAQDRIRADELERSGND